METGSPSFTSAAEVHVQALGGGSSRAFGITEGDLMVGSVDGNGIATTWTAPFAFTVVGPAILSQFHNVNDNGETVGYWNAGGGTIHAVRWTDADGSGLRTSGRGTCSAGMARCMERPETAGRCPLGSIGGAPRLPLIQFTNA